KQLSAAQREELFSLIQRRALVIGIGIADVEEIDRCNILHAALMAMRRAVEAVSLQIDFVLVDGNRLPNLTQPAQAVIRGDSRSLSIAAASIVAKVTRDRIMMQWHEQYPQYDFARHKGYPTRAHIEAIRRYGLSPIHRRSFHPKALNS
ncbi:MAG: ribonuclease HII, partial [candidate division KSB1 bacterium]|nr:ribonuclease HII [candidate division KSB1 bacterium]